MEHKSGDKIREIMTKIKDVKHIKIIICIMIVAVIMIVYSTALSKKNNDRTTTEKTTEITSAELYDENEVKLADILSDIDGVGKTKVMITYDAENKVSGAIIVAEGAEKPLAEWRIRHAVQTALQIDYQNIEVYSMK